MSSNPTKFQCKKCQLFFTTKQGLNIHNERMYPCKDKQDIKKDTIINTGKTIERLVDKIKELDSPEDKNISVEQEPVIVERNNFDNINNKIEKLSNILEILKNEDLMKNINKLNELLDDCTIPKQFNRN